MSDQSPIEVATQTVLTPEELEIDHGHEFKVNGKVTEAEIEDAVVMTNPDINSMESRG